MSHGYEKQTCSFPEEIYTRTHTNNSEFTEGATASIELGILKP